MKLNVVSIPILASVGSRHGLPRGDLGDGEGHAPQDPCQDYQVFRDFNPFGKSKVIKHLSHVSFVPSTVQGNLHSII